MSIDNEDWLINFSEELATPTLSHQVPPMLFLNSTINYDFLIFITLHRRCNIYRYSVKISVVTITAKLSQSFSPAAAGCLQPYAVSMEAPI